jgi:hypothetical protein
LNHGSQINYQRILKLVLTIILLGSSQSVSAQNIEAVPGTSPTTILENAKNAFRYQDYTKTLELVRPLLYPALRLTVSKEIQTAREYLASSHWWLKEKDKASELEDPGYQLDPFYYPAPLVSFFETLREELYSKGILDPKPRIPATTILKLTPASPPWTTNFLPFGMPQFGMKRNKSAWLLLSGQSLSLLTSIVSSLWIEYGLRGEDGYFAPEQVDNARLLKKTWIASTIIFTGLYSLGVINAFMQSASSSSPIEGESL